MIPTNKVTAGALTGALMSILIWGLKEFAKIELPAEVAVGVSTLISFVVSYCIPNKEQQ